MSGSQIIAASDARNNFSDLISQVQYQGSTVLIERYGEVVAKIVPVEVSEKQVVTRERFEKEVKEQPRQVAQTEQQATEMEQEVEAQPTEPELTQTEAQENLVEVSQEETLRSKPQETVMSDPVMRALQRLSALTKTRRDEAVGDATTSRSQDGTETDQEMNQVEHDSDNSSGFNAEQNQATAQSAQAQQAEEDKPAIIRKRIEI